ncbi:MAG: hypothetical protein ACW98Y_21560 [Candidatus Thorarchaeota archaeon]
MFEIELEEVDILQIMELPRRLPIAWKKVRHWSMMYRFRHIDSKLWQCNEKEVGYSCWFAGTLAIVLSLEYNQETMVCRINMSHYGRLTSISRSTADLIFKAVRLALSTEFEDQQNQRKIRWRRR